MVFAIASAQGVKPSPACRDATPSPTTHISSSVVKATTTATKVDQLTTSGATLSVEDQPQPFTAPAKRYQNKD